MDYYKFLDEYSAYDEWNNINEKVQAAQPHPTWGEPKDTLDFSSYKESKDVKDARDKRFTLFGQHDVNDAWLDLPDEMYIKDDRVNSPSHYTSGKREVIDTIEDAVKDAPSTIFGMLQGQVLKYVLRVWLKDNPLEDLKKARWYLDRLITHLSDYPGDNPPPQRRPGRLI